MNPREAVAHYVTQQPEATPYCVAYSAGMDSHVLLHLMTRLREQNRLARLRAVHVDHGLHDDSRRWCEHARTICQALGVQLVERRVRIDGIGDAARAADQTDSDAIPVPDTQTDSDAIPVIVTQVDGDPGGNDGPEAAARKARYSAFADVLDDGEHLLLAQHAEDQAETFLLQALRGSGPDGLAGIPRKRRFANGYMARPLLICSQESLKDHAREHGLRWLDDPSNLDHRFDRNFLRHQVMPLLKTRWPAASETLSRSALRSAAASQSLLILAKQDLASVQIPGTSELSIRAITDLPRERAFMALRLCIRQRGLRMPRHQDLVQVMDNLVLARADSAGKVNVRDYVIRRYRDRLYILPPQTRQAPFRLVWRAPFEPLTIPETGLTLTRALCEEQRIALPGQGPVIVKSRAGGELIKLGEPAFHKAVKKILQESGVPPWVRDSIPLLYFDDRLAAVWNLAVAVDCRQSPVAPKEDGRNPGMATGPVDSVVESVDRTGESHRETDGSTAAESGETA